MRSVIRAVSTWICLVAAPALVASLGSCVTATERAVPPLKPSEAPPTARPHGEQLRVSFLRDRVSLFWVPRDGTFDEVSRRWLIDLGEERWLRACSTPLPSEPYLRLVVEHAGYWWCANWPSDLAGLVDIRDAAQALEFVRIFSSPESWYRFPEFRYVEVRRGGSASLLDRLFRIRYAEIPGAEFDSLGLRDTEVIRTSAGFRIRRTLVKMDRSSPVAFAIVDESVGRNGEYCLRPLWEGGNPASVGAFLLPTYR